MAGKRSAFSTYNTLRKEARDPAAQAVYVEFGRRLQAQMQRHAWSQSDVARAVTSLLPKPTKGQKQYHQCGRDLVSHWVRGECLPRPTILPYLAKALRCKESDLIPPQSVPSVEGKLPVFETMPLGNDRVAIRLNRTVSRRTADTIVVLIRNEDAGR